MVYICVAKIVELEKLRIGIVNYLNTRPLLYGLERHSISKKIEIIGHYPSQLVPLLKTDEIDIGLIPIATLPEFDNAHIVGNYCIGTEGEIASVALFSDVPLEEIKTVMLDYQSRSSAALLQWLMKEYWNIHPNIEHVTEESYRSRIGGTTAGLVIGDRAFDQRKKSLFIYDLGSEWKKITGLPFVFACWVSKQKINEEFQLAFDEANAMGLSHIDEIVAKENYMEYDLKKYYTLHLSYILDKQKREAMKLFLQYLHTN